MDLEVNIINDRAQASKECSVNDLTIQFHDGGNAKVYSHLLMCKKKSENPGSNPGGATNFLKLMIMVDVNEIPACPGIYELNGKLNYSMNLQKKAKKSSGDFKIIKEMPNATLQELCKELHSKAEAVDFSEDKVVLHHYVNKNTGWSITSIYNNLKVDGYEQID